MTFLEKFSRSVFLTIIPFLLLGIGFMVVSLFSTMGADLKADITQAIPKAKVQKELMELPNIEEMSRAEIISMLVYLNGQKPDVTFFHHCFSDVTEQWHAPFICYAKDIGLVGGYDDGSFHPEETMASSDLEAIFERL